MDLSASTMHTVTEMITKHLSGKDNSTSTIMDNTTITFKVRHEVQYIPWDDEYAERVLGKRVKRTWTTANDSTEHQLGDEYPHKIEIKYAPREKPKDLTGTLFTMKTVKGDDGEEHFEMIPIEYTYDPDEKIECCVSWPSSIRQDENIVDPNKVVAPAMNIAIMHNSSIAYDKNDESTWSDEAYSVETVWVKMVKNTKPLTRKVLYNHIMDLNPKVGDHSHIENIHMKMWGNILLFTMECGS